MDILFFISIELLLVIIDIMDNSNIWIEYVTMSVHVYIFDSRYPLIFFFFLSLLNIHSTIIDFIANCQQYNIIQTSRFWENKLNRVFYSYENA